MADITVNTRDYNLDSSLSPDKNQFVGPAHDFEHVDTIVLGRTRPKPTATFRGVGRAELRRNVSVLLDDGNYGIVSITATASLPVGMAKADADAARDDVGDLLISTVGEALFWDQTIRPQGA